MSDRTPVNPEVGAERASLFESLNPALVAAAWRKTRSEASAKLEKLLIQMEEATTREDRKAIRVPRNTLAIAHAALVSIEAELETAQLELERLRRPDVAQTIEQLDALPFGTVVAHGATIYQRADGDSWFYPGWETSTTSEYIALPVDVVYRPAPSEVI